MIPWAFILKNSKILAYVAIGIAAMFLYNKYTNAIENAHRLEENASEERKKDSIGFAKKDLTKEEFKEEVMYTDPELYRQLREHKIELKNIKQLIRTQNTYVNTDTTRFLLNEILKGIQENTAAEQKIIDTTDCHVVEAFVHFDGKDLKLDVTKVGFITKTQIVAHAEKIGLRFWKWFRKRKITVTTLDSCGKSTTELITVSKN